MALTLFYFGYCDVCGEFLSGDTCGQYARACSKHYEDQHPSYSQAIDAIYDEDGFNKTVPLQERA